MQNNPNNPPNNLHLQFFSNPPTTTQANFTALAQALANTQPIQTLNLHLNPPNNNAAAINGLAQALNPGTVNNMLTPRSPSGGS